MSTRYDVAGRLAQGAAAVDDMQTYVAASQVRGYVNADLTLHAEQVKDWYSTEDGLDLHLLDSDCAQLHNAAQAADDALRTTHAQIAALQSTWSGGGGGAAVEFISRHSAAAAEVADAVRRAAQTCATLREQLWGAVDHKVSATVSIDDRTVAQRPGWLAAARAVIAGDQDELSVATVDAEVKSFVDSGIRGEWVPAMRSVTGDVTAFYRAATDAVGAKAWVRFEVPGDLGPRYVPPAGVSAAPAPVAVRPAAVLPPVDEWPANRSDPMVPVADSAAPPMAAAPLPPPASPPPPPTSLSPTPPTELPMPAAGSGSLPGSGGGGLGQLANPFGDLLGSLFGSPGDSLPDAPELPEAELDDPGKTDAVDDDGDDAEDPAESEDPADADNPAEAEDPAEPEAAADEPVPPTADPPPPAPPAQPLAAAPEADAAETKTPCEIAADELPQAGR